MSETEEIVQEYRMNRLVELQKFLSTCSDQSLGDLQLSRLNLAANGQNEFQEAAKKLLEFAAKMVEIADSWAQHEAEARYVTFVREATKIARADQVIEAKKLIRRKRKLLRNSVA
jgi:hypothetical protein